MTNKRSESKLLNLFRILKSIGPALIVACVVLGPGSILTSSKVGCQFGYRMEWVVALAGILMMGTVATASHVGSTLSTTPCTALAVGLGRPVALLAGITVFLIAACFQFSNNIGILASIEPLFDTTPLVRVILLAILNFGIVICLIGFKSLYQPLERLMMILVAMMLIGFAINLIMARPSIMKIASGFVPTLGKELEGSFFSELTNTSTATMNQKQNQPLVDPWLAIQGLVATTFSIAGAFYQCYLVREKGWTSEQTKQGVCDSVIGIFILVGISWMIMVTSAAVLSGNVSAGELRSAGDVAQQLEPLFGSTAKLLFCVGIFAGAFSSFLVNSVVGGTLLADGLGFDSQMDSPWTKAFTVLVLAMGMLIALATDSEDRVPLIIFAQAMTVLGGPVLAFSLIYLAWKSPTGSANRAPIWMLALSSLGAIVVIVLAIRTAVRIKLTLGI